MPGKRSNHSHRGWEGETTKRSPAHVEIELSFHMLSAQHLGVGDRCMEREGGLIKNLSSLSHTL